MTCAKKDDDTFESVSAFFMHGCKCPKSTNGFYQWACSTRQCKNCKDSKPAPLKCQLSNELVTADQFEVVKKEYMKVNRNGVAEKKTTKLTERVSTQMTYKELDKKLAKLQTAYTTHKYHEYNDVYHWPIILGTVAEYGEIFHSDYSENMSQMHLWDPISSL